MTLRSHRLGRTTALISVLALALAACTGSPVEEPTTTAGTDEPTTTAGTDAPTTTAATAEETTTTGGEGGEEGGILQVGVLDDVQAWDSSRLQSVLFPFHRNLYDTLADYEDGLNAVPRLATDWEISDAQDSVTITLREGVQFHSGREMTAEDVAANLEVFADPELGNQVYGPTSAAVEDWEVTGDHEIVVNLQRPTAELQITDLLTSWAIGDPEFFDVYASEAHGTGPFRMVEWVPGQSVTLEANNEYWGEGPFIDGIEYRILGDSDTMASALEAGDVDVITTPPASDATRLEEAGFTTVSAPPGAIIDQLRIDAAEPPWDNQNLRLALSYAADMEGINDAIYEGLGTVVRLPYAPNSPAFDEDLAATMAYDIDRAQELLETSGLPESEWSGTIMVPSNDVEDQLVAQIVQQSLASIGFTLELDSVDAATASDRYFNSDFQLFWSGIGNAQKYPTRISTNSIYRPQENPVFDMGELFPEYPEAIDAANAAVTEEEQQAGFDELNRVLTEQMWAVSGIARPMLTSTAPSVTGVYKDIDAQDHFNLVRIER